MENETAPNFKFSDIEIIDFSLNSLQHNLSEHPVFQFELNLEYRLKIDVNSVVVMSKISILNEDKKQIYAKLSTACIFNFNQIEPFLVKKDSKFILIENAVESLNSICISTNRGILFTLLRGTYLHNTILPIIEVSALQIVQ